MLEGMEKVTFSFYSQNPEQIPAQAISLSLFTQPAFFPGSNIGLLLDPKGDKYFMDFLEMVYIYIYISML